ncbi:hypothetical protein Tco_0777679 [Tanacetum coccineum]
MRQRRLIKPLSDYDCVIRYHSGKANVVTNALSMKDKEPIRVHAVVVISRLNNQKPSGLHQAAEIPVWKIGENYNGFHYKSFQESPSGYDFKFGSLLLELTKSAPLLFLMKVPT